MTKWMTYLVLVFISIPGITQELKSSVSASEFMIGQPVTLTYSVKLDLNDSIHFTQKESVLEARSIEKTAKTSRKGIEFEIIQEFRDTTKFFKDYKEWIGEYVITAWDSGIFVLPGQNILLNDSSYVFDDVALAIYLTDPIAGVNLYDIKENFADIPPSPFSFKKFVSNNWWWMLLVLLIPIVILIVRKKKKNVSEPVKKTVSLKERTIIAIEALEQAKLWEKNKLKEHFVELSYILRSYLTSRYDISLLEKTTYETKLLLTQKGLNQDTVELITKILSQSDMVKFAKSNPDVIAILRVSNQAKQIVAETSPLDFDNAE